jgi:hypothetical protein
MEVSGQLHTNIKNIQSYNFTSVLCGCETLSLAVREVDRLRLGCSEEYFELRGRKWLDYEELQKL